AARPKPASPKWMPSSSAWIASKPAPSALLANPIQAKTHEAARHPPPFPYPARRHPLPPRRPGFRSAHAALVAARTAPADALALAATAQAGTDPRRTPAPGAAGSGADLHQIRPVVVDPP